MSVEKRNNYEFKSSVLTGGASNQLFKVKRRIKLENNVSNNNSIKKRKSIEEKEIETETETKKEEIVEHSNKKQKTSNILVNSTINSNSSKFH